MSYRELAEAAPCGLRTVQRAIPRLKAAGWLYEADRGRGRTVTDESERHERADATRWRLRVERASTDARLDHTGGTPRTRTELSVVMSRARLDACRWGGIGLNAPRVLDVLTERGPLDVRELAALLGMDRGHLRARLLKRLAEHGLVVRGPDGRWSVVDDLTAALETAADALGLTGKADAVAASVSSTASSVTSPKDGWVALYANNITVDGTITASGRGYGGGGGGCSFAYPSGCVSGGFGGSLGLGGAAHHGPGEVGERDVGLEHDEVAVAVVVEVDEA